MIKYIFTENEFITLLALSGLTSAYAFRPEKDMEDGELIEALHSLYRRGMITEKESGFDPVGSAEEIVEAIRRAEYVFLMDLPEAETFRRLIYPVEAGRLLVMEKSHPAAEKRIKLQLIQTEDFVDELLENELEEMISPKAAAGLAAEELVEDDVPEEQGADDFDLTVFMLRRKKTLSEEEISSLSLHMTAAAYRIVRQDESGLHGMTFTMKAFAGLLTDELRGDMS